MENQEKILNFLEEFDKSPSKNIPPTLEDYLKSVAKTGKTVFQWPLLKSLLVQKLELVMDEFNKDEPFERANPLPNVENAKFDEMKKRILEALQKFNSAPFTVQRLCELVTSPKKHYTQCDKFLRGIEKNVLVVTTVDPQGRKIVSESRFMVNGLDSNGVDQQHDSVNEFTDEKPFGSVPQIDWSSNHATAVWPAKSKAENQSSKNNDTDCRAVEKETVYETKKDENKSVSESVTVDNEAMEDSSSDTSEDTTEDDVIMNNSTTKEVDQSQVVSDSVRLPPTSTLFSRIEKDDKTDSDNEDCVTDTETKSSKELSMPEQTDGVVALETPCDVQSEEPETVLALDKSLGSKSVDPDPNSSLNPEESPAAQATEAIEGVETTTPETVSSTENEAEGPPEKKMKLSSVKDNITVSSSSPVGLPDDEESRGFEVVSDIVESNEDEASSETLEQPNVDVKRDETEEASTTASSTPEQASPIDTPVPESDQSEKAAKEKEKLEIKKAEDYLGKDSKDDTSVAAISHEGKKDPTDQVYETDVKKDQQTEQENTMTDNAAEEHVTQDEVAMETESATERAEEPESVEDLRSDESEPMDHE